MSTLFYPSFFHSQYDNSLNLTLFEKNCRRKFYRLLFGGLSLIRVLEKLPVPGRPTNLDHSRTRAYCACSRCRRGCLDIFSSRLSFLSSFSPSLGDGPI